MAASKQNSSKRGPRKRRRDRSHSDSHAESTPLKPIPDHPDVPAGEVELVTDTQGLQAVVDDLSASDLITFDTEFIGEETYYPQLCLVQVGTRERVHLIDPLAISDLTSLWDVIASPKHTTLVHAGRQDLQILTRQLGHAPEAIVDTQLLAGLAGLPWPCSLTKSVQSVIDAPMPPGMTFTAWDARPLSAKQLRYAADDVRYLPILHANLHARIATAGHEQWACDACRIFEDAAWYESDLDAQRRKIEGARRFKKTQRRVLQRLVEVRDAVARQENLPPRTTMPDAVLLQVVRDRPDSAEKIAGMRGMPTRVAHRHGDAFLATLEDDGVEPPEVARKPGDESPGHRMAIDGLWHMFCALAIARGIAPGLASSRTDLANWYIAGRNGMPGKASWQQDICAAILDPLLSGATTIDLHWNEGRLEQMLAKDTDATS